ncbi:hypothetical protein CON36_35155 [Bacillus cereus]|uniref:Uncharacterized protein n=2 Tax=Bacillus cereus group TaxID=86661 RepID=A0A9X6XV20_BACCE|nr:hypothetical protein CON36_35155 [Bacillus cereus]PFJ31820.1 hypothetical protein COJ15_29405 [Bacillus thuringiensis]
MFFKFKPISFILSVISIIICIINYMGYDNKDMILFFTSPPLWLSKTEWFVENIGPYKDVPLFLKYIFTITFWSLVGERIDRGRSAAKDRF